MERALIINAGSSSVKFRLFGCEPVLEGVVDRIGNGSFLDIGHGEQQMPIASHKEAGILILSLLPVRPELVIHRIVHGGPRRHPTILDRSEIASLLRLAPLAPLHMPSALSLVELFGERLEVPQVGCYDTMFHRTMPRIARTYAIPQDLARKHGIEHYGFHGIAHGALARQSKELFGRAHERSITCQLGNGASVCAIKGGKSVDTSMGFTPLEGLMMGTRSGDIDPAIVEFLCEREGMSVAEVTLMLEHESGLKALAGTNDVRDLLRRKDAAARFALDLFAYRVRKQVGAYIAALGGVDAIVLGGGVARSSLMRRRLLSGLSELGVVLDERKIARAPPVEFGSGRVACCAIEVDEQEEMLRLVKHFLQGRG